LSTILFSNNFIYQISLVLPISIPLILVLLKMMKILTIINYCFAFHNKITISINLIISILLFLIIIQIVISP